MLYIPIVSPIGSSGSIDTEIVCLRLNDKINAVTSNMPVTALIRRVLLSESERELNPNSVTVKAKNIDNKTAQITLCRF